MSDKHPGWVKIEARNDGDTYRMEVVVDGRILGWLYRSREWMPTNDSYAVGVGMVYVPISEKC